MSTAVFARQQRRPEGVMRRGASTRRGGQPVRGVARGSKVSLRMRKGVALTSEPRRVARVLRVADFGTRGRRCPE